MLPLPVGEGRGEGSYAGGAHFAEAPLGDGIFAIMPPHDGPDPIGVRGDDRDVHPAMVPQLVEKFEVEWVLNRDGQGSACERDRSDVVAARQLRRYGLDG